MANQPKASIKQRVKKATGTSDFIKKESINSELRNKSNSANKKIDGQSSDGMDNPEKQKNRKRSKKETPKTIAVKMVWFFILMGIALALIPDA